MVSSQEIFQSPRKDPLDVLIVDDRAIGSNLPLRKNHTFANWQLTVNIAIASESVSSPRLDEYVLNTFRFHDSPFPIHVKLFKVQRKAKYSKSNLLLFIIETKLLTQLQSPTKHVSIEFAVGFQAFDATLTKTRLFVMSEWHLAALCECGADEIFAERIEENAVWHKNVRVLD